MCQRAIRREEREGTPAARKQALLAEAKCLERREEALRANDLARLWVLPPARNLPDPEALYAQLRERAGTLRREAGAIALAPPVRTRYECPICGGPHSRADHPSRQEGSRQSRRSD